MVAVESILDNVAARPGIVVITGGEPLIHARNPAFRELLEGLHRVGREIHMESNGTILPPREVSDLLDVVVLSPKLANAGVHRGGQDPNMDARWTPLAREQEIHLKFVCTNQEDVRTASEFADQLGWLRKRVWVMPEGTSRASLDMRLPTIADAAIEFGLNVCTRIHILAWGDQRGR